MTTIVSGSSITFNDNTTQNTSAYGGGFAFRNRIINGGMVIDQRNAGASVTPTSDTYTLDRWSAFLNQASKFSVQRSTTAPTGFSFSALITSTSAYSVTSGDLFAFGQYIEGFNTADLMWGTANAQTITLSFWVRSSLTGTFGGAIRNNAANRSYPFSYTISAANTWEQKSITIAGDTSGTWVGATNGTGLQLFFGLGVGSTFSGTAGSWNGNNNLSATGATSVVGTNGATFYITGVQLEKGSTATSFDYRPYGTELALCQRYYEKSYPASSPVPTNTVLGPIISLGTQTYAGGTGANQMLAGTVYFKVTKRATPTITIYSWTSSTVGAVSTGWTGADLAANTGTIGDATINGFSIYNGSGSNVTTNGYAILFQFAASAEL